MIARVRSRVAKRLEGKTPAQALIMVTLMMMVLIGFAALATDTGMIWVNRRSLQNAADAAALAGAQELKPGDSLAPDAARAMASDYADLNTITGMTYDPTANGATSETCDAQPNVDLLVCRTYVEGDTIRVTVHKRVNPIFGMAVGFDGIDIAARATAVKGSIQSACIVPIFQTKDLLEESGVWANGGVVLNQQTVMKTSAGDVQSGNFLALQVDGSSSKADWKDAMADPTRCTGENQPQQEDTATTSTGNFVGPFDQGMELRKAAWDAQGTCGPTLDATTYLSEDGTLRYPDGTELTNENCYRMVKIPLLAGTVTEFTGTEKTVEIEGFLVFYISNWCGQSSDPKVRTGECDPPSGISEPLEQGELWGYFVRYEEGGVDAQPYDGYGTDVVMLIE